MSTRMNRYNNEEEVKESPRLSSRLSRNENLYKEISKNELDNYEIKSNSTVLGDNKDVIDVEKIKKILDTKYNTAPRRNSLRLNNEEYDDLVDEVKEDTKEYDINVVLESAKENKVDNYEEERLKKIRDTQFDILKNLKLDEQEKDEETPEENLKNLINTIAINENKNSNNNTSLDILSDLKGNDDTEILDGLKEEVKAEEKKELDTQMINSFYTKSNIIKEKDFEDLDDFSKSIESNNTFVKVIITLIVIIFIGGIIFLIKTLYFS